MVRQISEAQSPSSPREQQLARVREARTRARKAPSPKSSQVMLGPDAISDLERAGLDIRLTGVGIRRGVFISAGRRRVLLVELVPLGPSEWEARIADHPPSGWTARQFKGFRTRIRAAFGAAEQLQKRRRATALAARLSHVEMLMTKPSKKAAKGRTGVPDERLANPFGVLQGGAPGLKQQRR